MEAADAVAAHGVVQRQQRHLEIAGRSRAGAQVHQLVAADADAPRQLVEIAVHEFGGKTFVAGVHGRVRGEDAVAAHHFAGGGEAEAAGQAEMADAFQDHEGRVPFVHVVGARMIAQRRQRARAAHAEQDLLADARVAVGHVKALGDAAVFFGVLGRVGVEQIERHAPDLNFPDAGEKRARGQVERHVKVFAGLSVFDAADGQQPEIVLRIERRLVAVGSDFLLEVTALVKQPHGDQRDAQVAGRLEVVAGQHAETAGVNGQTFVDAVLGRKVGDGRCGRQFGNRLVERRLHVGVESFQSAAVKLGVSFVPRQLDKAAVIGFSQQFDGVVPDFVPQRRIDAAEQRLVFGMPRPPEIVC